MTSLKDLLAALAQTSMREFCTDVPVITRSNRYSKRLLAPCAQLAGLIAAWRACCPARRDCCDRGSRLRRRQPDLGEESRGLPGIPVCGHFRPARGRRGRQNTVTRSRAFFGNVESSSTRSEHCSARCHLTENSASRHLPWNAVDVRVLGRSPWHCRIGFAARVLPTFYRSSQSASRRLEPFARARERTSVRRHSLGRFYVLHAQLLGACSRVHDCGL